MLINHRGLVKQKFFFPKTRSMQYVLSNSSGLLFLTKQFKKKKVLRVHFNYLSSLLNKDQLSNFTVQKSFHLILITLTRPKIQFDDFNFRKCKCNKSSFCIQIEFYIILREWKLKISDFALFISKNIKKEIWKIVVKTLTFHSFVKETKKHYFAFLSMKNWEF